MNQVNVIKRLEFAKLRRRDDINLKKNVFLVTSLIYTNMMVNKKYWENLTQRW